MKRIKLKIFGRVQGVGYRHSVWKYTQSVEGQLMGHVENLADGTVEVVAEGEQQALEQLEKFCWKGSVFCEVKKIERVELPLQEGQSLMLGFNIKR